MTRDTKDNLGLRVVVSVLLTVLVGGLDVFMVRAAVLARATGNYRETRGTILSSSVRIVRDSSSSSGSTFGVNVAYSYSVDGRAYTGHRYEPTEVSESGTWAEEVVAQLGAGVVVPVYYPASDPRSAVLVRGLQGSNLLWPLMLVPFNLMALGLWWGVRLVLRARAAGQPYVDPPPGPWTWAFITMGASGLILLAIVAIAFGTHPSVATAQAAWALVPLLSVAAFVAARLRGARPRAS